MSGDGGAAYVDGVCVDITRSGRAVAVADGPGLAGEFLGGGAGCRVVDVMAGLLV